MPDLNTRFVEAMEELGLSGYGLSRELGTSEAVISNIRNGKNPPNILLVRSLLNKYEELDPDWLLFGRGRMFRRSLEGTQRGGGGQQGTVNETLERLGRIEDLLRRSLAVQLERDVLVDESLSDLNRQMEEQERQLRTLRKALDKRP